MDPNSAAETEKAYGLLKDKADLTDARYCDLQLKSKSRRKRVSRSAGLRSRALHPTILGAPTGKPLKKLAVKTGTSYTHSGLKKGTYYKYAVVACKKAGGTDQVLNKSKVIYVATKGGKAANVSKIKLNKKKTSLKLKKKKKKTFRIKAKTVKKGKKIKKYARLRYESSNDKIASVNKSGKVTAKGKGSCVIYVYAQDGISTKLKVSKLIQF